jgi:hypothetical protein
MSAVDAFAGGGYRYIPAVFQYSSGVAAEPGFEIERARFVTPRPLKEAFAAVEQYLGAIGRPVAAFAACELRSPEPFTEQGFREFNQAYVVTLEHWGIYKGGDKAVNPVARTNVCPMYDAPPEPVMIAFSYTVPVPSASKRSLQTFVLAGGGEALGPGSSHRDRIVRRGDTSPEGMRDKVLAVTQEMERRLGLLGFSWNEAGSTQAYTVQNIGHLVGEVLAARGACTGGLVWTYAWPPVVELEFEMDVRRVARELLV